jgi:DNA-binding transcriptional LysR family regulator
MRIPPPKAIIAFESVARTNSVNRAADELRLTPSAVSHQIANLESMVGRPLFTRLGRGLVLTPTGQQYLADVTGSLADLSRATERASSQSGVEILRIHSSPSFGLMWLLPRLASFHEANGDIQLNLACSYEDVSLPPVITISMYGMATPIGPMARSKRFAMNSSPLLHRRNT